MRVAFIRMTFCMRLAFVRIVPEDDLSPEGALSGLFLIRMTLHRRVVFCENCPPRGRPFTRGQHSSQHALTQDVVLVAGEGDEVDTGGSLWGQSHRLERVAVVREQHHLVRLLALTTQALTLATGSRSHTPMLVQGQRLDQFKTCKSKQTFPFHAQQNIHMYEDRNKHC